MNNETIFLRMLSGMIIITFILSDVFGINFLPDISLEKDVHAQILPEDGFELPVSWGELGMMLIENGTIDEEKFIPVHDMTDEAKSLLYGLNKGNIRINMTNSRLFLNLLWALGLGNKNEILENGPMTYEEYGGDASRFASTAGWSLAKGNPMDHYSKHEMVILTSEQQALVEEVAKNIFRPCCNNPTHFPDCNHGMAMLGFLQLMASQGVDEKEMYDAALKLNSFWFPETYMNIAEYLDTKGYNWGKVEPKIVLGFSSIQEYNKIVSEMNINKSGGASCGV